MPEDSNRDLDDGKAGDWSADRPKADYWDRVEEFELLWERHVERWPEGPKRQGDDGRLPGDLAGSWRGDGGRYLSREQNAEADGLIAALHEPEPQVTALLRTIQRENPFGGRLAGLEHRLKEPERLKEKIADRLKKEVGSSTADAIDAISDLVRYTFCIDRADYVPGHDDIEHRLESAGYKMMYRRNHWVSDPQYNGVNTRWVTPTGGRFELQFHTEESLHAKERLTHPSYRRLRSPDTSWVERQELEGFQEVVSAAVSRPSGVETIKDHGRNIP